MAAREDAPSVSSDIEVDCEEISDFEEDISDTLGKHGRDLSDQAWFSVLFHDGSDDEEEFRGFHVTFQCTRMPKQSFHSNGFTGYILYDIFMNSSF